MSSSSLHPSSTISLISTVVSNIPGLPSSTFSVPSLSSPSSSPDPSESSSPGQNGDLALYLYTFLATLILLLSVSSAIVVRSLIIRRRHNRMIAEAIANGTWSPNAANEHGSAGEKPGFFEAFVSGPGAAGAAGRPKDGGVKETVENRGEKDDIDWQDIMPFSATYLVDDDDDATPTDGTKPPTSTLPPPPLTPQTPLGARHRFASAFRRVRTRAIPAPLLPLPVSARAANPPSPFLLASPSPSARDEAPSSPVPATPMPASPLTSPVPVPSTIRVAVLIAMPVPPTPASSAAQSNVYGSEEEEEIPHVEFGVADVEVVAGNEQSESWRVALT